ncbi:transcriptional repressor [Deltaproteobacteria bacterium]|nr:transcriptional repressor [Deltaproteobacteria bacterium]
MTSVTNDFLNCFLQFMNRKGLNTTSQRCAIAAAFFDLPGHHSLEEFYQHIVRQDPGIGQTTVYRTLKLLCEAGFASEIHFSDGIARYEVAKPNSHHDHIVCLSCGKILEICNQRIEALQRELAASRDFTLSGHVHNLYGCCADCRNGVGNDKGRAAEPENLRK